MRAGISFASWVVVVLLMGGAGLGQGLPTASVPIKAEAKIDPTPEAAKPNVTGQLPTTTALTASGSAGNYTLTAAVGSSGRSGSPSGKVQFFDTTNNNALLGTGLIGGGPTSLGFYNSANSTVGFQPLLTATGDFNGDGFKDVAVVAADNTLTIVLGKGDGTFNTLAPVQLSTLHSDYSNLTRIFVADFNGNGRDDLVLDDVIVLSNADGTFSSYIMLSYTALAVGDFNKDGISDYVGSDPYEGIQTFLGKGDGTFQLVPLCSSSNHTVPCQTPYTSLSEAIATGDFNHDGALDIAFSTIAACLTSSTMCDIQVLLGNGDGTFTAGPASPIVPATGDFVDFIAPGDFNHDGLIDLAIETFDGFISILIGNGDATFRTGETEPVAAIAELGNLALGDFNGDGYQDIAYVASTVGFGTGLTILQGNGNGTFSTISVPASTSIVTPFTLASADFNGDGMSDLVSTDLIYCLQSACNYNTASVFLGQVQQSVSISGIYLQGTGTHQVDAVYSGDTKYLGSTSSPVPLDGSLITTATTLVSSANPSSVGSTVTFTAYIQPLFGSGVPTGTITGSLNGGQSITLPLDSTGHANYTLSGFPLGNYTIVATYSGDANYASSTATLLERIVGGTGSTSVAGITILSGAGQSSAVGTAFAKPIVVQVTNLSGAAVPGVSLSFAGAGLTFSSATATTNSAGQASVTATPTLGGILPATVSVTSTGLFATFTENGIAAAATTPPATTPMAILPTGASSAGASLLAAVGDFNGDGFADLATTNTIDATVSVLLGKGNGTFQAAVNYGVGNGPYAVVAGDFNGDGKADLAVVNGLDGTVSILLNNAGAFPAKPSFTYSVGSQPYGVSVADLNRDGALDLVVTNNASKTLSVLLGKGDGSFSAAVSYAVGNYPFGTAVADFNNDGYPDLAVWNYGDNAVGVLLNNKAGGFLPQTTYATGASPYSVTMGDFNGDGYPDLAVANLGGNSVSVLLNNKAGGFAAGVSYAVGSLPTSALAVDLNGDGVLDVAAANLGDGTVSVLLGKGDGTFLAQTVYAAGTQPYFLQAADFNGDGKPDLAVTNFFTNSVGVLLQTSSGTAIKMKGSPPRSLKTVPVQ